MSGKEGKKRLGKARKVISEKGAKSRGPLDNTSSNNDDWSGAAKFLGNACKKRDKIVAPAAKDDAHDNRNNKDSDTTKPIAASQAQGVVQRTRVESAKDDNNDSHNDYGGNNNDNEVSRRSLIAAGQGEATGLSDYSGENSGYGAEKSAKGTIKNNTCSRKEGLEALLRNHGERVRAQFGSAAAVEPQKGRKRTICNVRDDDDNDKDGDLTKLPHYLSGYNGNSPGKSTRQGMGKNKLGKKGNDSPTMKESTWKGRHDVKERTTGARRKDIKRRREQLEALSRKRIKNRRENNRASAAKLSGRTITKNSPNSYNKDDFYN